jgi:tetratricopeptide (TPR) repeat protein
LFVERARDLKPSFTLDSTNAAAIVAICRELDGLPLAIELAATRIKVLQPGKIADKLKEKFQLLRSNRRDLPPRHQTLLAAIEWSFGLLDDSGKYAFMQACVFRGGFTLEAAEAVIDLAGFPQAPPVIDVVQSLCDQSLLRTFDAGQETRFGMYLALREYGEQRWLATANAEQQLELHRRHAAYYVPFAETWDDRILTADGLEALDRLTTEVENLFACQDRALEASDPETACRAITASARTMWVRGLADQRAPRLGRSLAALPAVPTALRARLLAERADAFLDIGDWDEAAVAADEAVATAERLDSPVLLARALCSQAAGLRVRGFYDAALRALERGEAICRRLGEQRLLASILSGQGRVYYAQGFYAPALECLAEAEQIERELGDLLGLAAIMTQRGSALCDGGDPRKALECYAEAEGIFQRFANRYYLAALYNNRGTALDHLGDCDRALASFADAEIINRELGNRWWLAANLNNRGMVLSNSGEYDRAIACFSDAQAINSRLGNRGWMVKNLLNRGTALQRSGNLTNAVVSFAEAAAIATALGDKDDLCWIAICRGRAFLNHGDSDAAAASLADAERLMRETATGNFLADIRDGQGRGLRASGQLAEASEALREALVLRKTSGGTTTAAYFKTIAALAEAEATLGNQLQARELAEEALAIATTLGFTANHRFIEVREAIVVVHRILDQPPAAAPT